MAFFPSDASKAEYGEHASLLLALTEELGLPIWSVRTVPGGFEAHDAVVNQLLPTIEAPAVPEITAPAVEEKTPPAWWNEPEPTVDVVVSAEGKVFLTDEAFMRELEEAMVKPIEPDREAVRAWAKEHGFQVAEKGQLKKAVYEAYQASLEAHIADQVDE